MKDGPYARFKTSELILRDYLAADRTVLANERTLLSYLRTTMAFAAAGAALIHFFPSALGEVGGWLLVLLAVGILAIGAQRYLRTRQHLVKLLDKTDTTDAS